MLTIEDITNRLMGSKGAAGRFLIGGVLAFIPIVNIASLGYLYRSLAAFRDNNSVEMPAWDRPDKLAIESLRCLILWVLFFALPIGVTLLLWKLLIFVLPAFAAHAAWPLVAIGFVKAPILFTAALCLFQKNNDLRSLAQLPSLMLTLRPWVVQIIVSIATFWGLVVLCWPFYGFVLFGGGVVLVLYLSQIVDAACKDTSQ